MEVSVTTERHQHDAARALHLRDRRRRWGRGHRCSRHHGPTERRAVHHGLARDAEQWTKLDFRLETASLQARPKPQTATSTDNDVTTEAVSGTFTVTSADGLASITIDPDGSDTTVVVTLAQLLAANPGSPVVIETVEGKLAITGYNSATGVVSYTYTLEDNQNHSGGSVTDVFTITAADPNLDTSAPVTLTININDDAPTAKADTNSVSEGVGNFATGNVVTGGNDGYDANTTDGVADVPGADGFNGAVVGVAKGTTGAALVNAGTVGVNIVGDYGVLTLNANGTYSYNPNENLNNASGATDKFTYTIRDGDGDLSFTALTITINDGAVAAHRLL